MAGEQDQGAKPPFDDHPLAAAGQPPELRAPLAPFGGEPPPAPAWFEAALAQAPERAMVPTPRGRIETLTWGERGKPGLLFVHGNTAHADWWSFIAPMFARDYRVAAMSLAGMGDSDWRDRYGAADFAADAEAVAQFAGLYEGGRKPVYIGHSFGGGQVFYAAARHPQQMHAAIIIDVGFRGPPEDKEEAVQLRRLDPPAANRGPTRVYPTLAEALARFRLSPAQPAANLFIVDLLARRGLRRVPLADGSGEGWTWKFDPNMWDKLDRGLINSFFAAPPPIDVPLAHVFGELSLLMSMPGLQDAYPADGLLVGVPQAHHHVMVDQPLALVTAIRGLLAAWRA
jgi:pimeloyl-ACP methyl ester carboxylesterase